MRKTIRLLAGGSPCTQWSIAQKNNRETEPSGIGWELFLNYVIAWRSGQFDHFLYENNKGMAKPVRNQIDIEFNRAYAENTNWELISSVEEDKGHTKRWIWRNKTTSKVEYITRILINSALVSAQNRQRYYWTNIPNVQQPADRGILLKDILESGTDLSQNEKGYALTTRCQGAIPEDTIQKHRHSMVAEPIDYQSYGELKSGQRLCVTEPVCVAQRGRYTEDGRTEQQYEARTDGKTNAITTVQKDNSVAEPVCMRYERSEKAKKLRKQYEAGEIHHGFHELSELHPRTDGKTNTLSTVLKDNPICEPVRVGHFNKGGQGDRVYSIEGKSVCLSANGGGGGAKTGLYAIPVEFENGIPIKAISCSDGKTYPVYHVENGLITIKDKQYPIKLPDGYYIIRKLTVKECMRLQTVREDYIFPVSNFQAYRMLGNGWTVEVIKHIISHIPDIANCDIEVLSMYDGMSCGNLALEGLGCNVTKYVSYEIDEYAIQTTQANFPFVEQRGDAFQVREPYWQYDNGQLRMSI